MAKKFLIALALLIAVPSSTLSSAAVAATGKPSHKPSPQPIATAKAKRPSTSPSKPQAVKRTSAPTKRVYRRPVVRKHIAVTPSPSPIWPPVNFQKNKSGDSYAKILKNEELIGLASASPVLTSALAPCSHNACAAVIVASENICAWWNITSSVTGISAADSTKRVVLGSLRTLANGTPKQGYETIILVSSEAVAPGVRVEGINANCMTSAATETLPANIYTPINNG